MTLGYSTRLVESVKAGDAASAGVKLGRVCISRNYSVKDVADYLGVTRMTVYRWFRGYDISPRHSHKVQELLAKLK